MEHDVITYITESFKKAVMGPKKQQFGFNVPLVVRTTVELPTWYIVKIF